MPSACWWTRISRAVIVEVVAGAPTTRLAPAAVAVKAVAVKAVVTRVVAEMRGEAKEAATKVADLTWVVATRDETKERAMRADATRVDGVTPVVMTAAARKALVRRDDQKVEAAAPQALDTRQIFRLAEVHRRVAVVVAEADDAEAAVDAVKAGAVKAGAMIEAETIVTVMTATDVSCGTERLQRPLVPDC